MTRTVGSPLLDDGAGGQGSPSRQPLLPSDPWNSNWVPPTAPIVAQRHRDARRLQQRRAAPSQDATASPESVEERPAGDQPEPAAPHTAPPTESGSPQFQSWPTDGAVALAPTPDEASFVEADYVPVAPPPPPRPPAHDLSKRINEERRADRRGQRAANRLSALLSAAVVTATAYWHYASASW